MTECSKADSVLGGSEAVYDFYCELCHEDGLHVEAEGFCTNCDEYFCGQCFKDHRKNRFTRHHKVLDKDNMPNVTPPSADKVKKDINTTCHQHTDNLVEFYCKSHEKFVCSLCLAVDHRSCRDIKSINEDSQSIFDSNEYKDFKQNIESLSRQVHGTVTNVRDNLDKSGQCFSEVMDSLRCFKEEMISFLNELEASLIAQIDKCKTDKTEKAESITGTCATLQETIDKITSEFENLQSKNRVCQTYIRMKETMTDIKDIERQLRQVREDNTFESLIFVPNEDLRKLFTGPEGLGSLSMKETAGQEPTEVMYDGSPASFLQDSTPEGQRSLYMESRVSQVSTPVIKKMDLTPVYNDVSSASFVQDITVRSSNDKKCCWITGSAILSDSRLVIADYENCKIKLIGIDCMTVISELQVPESPWDVTVIKEDQVAITVYNNYKKKNKILVLKVSKSITKEREIKVNGECDGIAYSKKQLIVTYISPPKLEIMNLQGNVINRIENDKDGNKLFQYPGYVCVSSDGDTIYVSDWNANSVVSLSRNGDVKAIYTENSLEYPTKVCLDHRGNVFVCGQFSRYIHMLTSECTKIKGTLTQTDGLRDNVYSVSHCGLTDKLYVGMYNYDKIKVYQLS